MAKHILEDHRAALKLRQLQKRLKADRDDVRLGQGRCFDVVGERNDGVPGPAAKQVEARIVGDAKQLTLKIVHSGGLGSCTQRFDEGILQYVLTIDR